MYIDLLRHTFQYHDVGKGQNKEFSPTDIILEYLVLQNADVMGEMRQAFEQLSNGLKTAFEQLSNGIQDNFDILDTKTTSTYTEIRNTSEEMANAVVKKLSDKISDFESEYKDDQKTKVKTPINTPSGHTKIPQKKTDVRRRTTYLNKPKLLYVGDSIAHNADIAHIEKVTKSRIRTEKSYSSIHDKSARYPNQNFSKVIPEALSKVQDDDEFTHLILSAPTVDITNMNTAKLTSKDNIEVYKKKVVRSCENMFTVGQEALKKHPKLKYVVIMEHVPRYDLAATDPTGLKPKLAKFANSTFEQLWADSAI